MEIEAALGTLLYHDDNGFKMDSDILNMNLDCKIIEINQELNKFNPNYSPPEDNFDFNFICFYDLLGSNLPVFKVYDLCTQKINSVSEGVEFDITDLKAMITLKDSEAKDMKIDPIKYSDQITVKLEKAHRDKFEIGMLSITNKRAKDEVANTTYNTIIANWKKKEKEEVRTFNELLNKVVLDKIDTFKTEVVTLFDSIYTRLSGDENKERDELLNELSIGLLKKAMNDHKLSQN